MGSTGSGSFTDYPGGSGSDDQCYRAFAAALEDVEHGAYFKARAAVPPVGTVLALAHQKRIVAVTEAGEVVGSLPIRLNYLAGCLRQGYTYTGHVLEARSGPVVVVLADFIAAPP